MAQNDASQTAKSTDTIFNNTLRDRSRRLDACVASVGGIKLFLSNSAYCHNDSDHAEC